MSKVNRPLAFFPADRLEAETLAHQIRYQRVDLGRNERDIAHQFTNGRTDSQLVGRDLCHTAARVLGEDGRRHPWNLKAGTW